MAFSPDRVSSVLELWASKRRDTHDIAKSLMMREADVERIIHADREARHAAKQRAA